MKPCHHCGIQYHYAIMQFDHRYGPKKFNLSDAAREERTKDEIDFEIAKCAILCACCHSAKSFAESHDIDVKTFFVENNMPFTPPRPVSFSIWTLIKRIIVALFTWITKITM